MRAWPGAAPRRRPGRARRRAPRRGLRLRRDAAGHSRARPTPGGRARLGGALARDRVWPRLPRPALRRDEDRLGVGRRDREPDGYRLEPRREPGRRRAVVRDHAVRDGRHGRAGAAQPERGAAGSPRGAALRPRAACTPPSRRGGAGRSPPRARSLPAAGSGSRSARSSRPAILRTTCRASSSGSRTTRTTYGRGPDVRGP